MNKWITYVDKLSEEQLNDHFYFTNPGGKKLKLKIKDLLLQLNYHSIHHRAQINTLISKQGIKPPATDYIFTVLEDV